MTAKGNKQKHLTNMGKVVSRILTDFPEMPTKRSMLVGISGIDASGKGFITAKLAKELNKQNINTIVINADGWLNLPHIRFNKSNPAKHFYENVIRFDELFEKLILPLKENRRVNLMAELAEETAIKFNQYEYNLQDIDVILLEGIFLFKRDFQNYFDLKIWIECSFDTAIQRAIARSQEGLSRDATIVAYDTIYFPAQRLHIAEASPKESSNIIFNNDTP